MPNDQIGRNYLFTGAGQFTSCINDTPIGPIVGILTTKPFTAKLSWPSSMNPGNVGFHSFCCVITSMILSAGCIGSNPGARSTFEAEHAKAEALRSWNFGDQMGDQRLVMQDIGWIDIAIPIGKPNAPNVSMTLEWTFQSWGQLPIAFLTYSGFFADKERPMAGAANHATGVYQDASGSNTYRLSLRALDRGEAWQTGSPLPQVSKDGRSGRATTITFNVGKELSQLLKGGAPSEDRPLFRKLILFCGASREGTFKLETAWRDTIPGISIGNNNDTFLVDLRDFSGDAAASVDLDVVKANLGGNLQFSPTFGSTTAFVFRAPSDLLLTPEPTKPYVVGPDGRTRKVPFDQLVELAGTSGKWTFNVPSPTEGFSGRLPVIWGARYEPAVAGVLLGRATPDVG